MRLDIFVKYNVQERVYCYVGGNIMRVASGFYEVVNYMGLQFSFQLTTNNI